MLKHLRDEIDAHSYAKAYIDYCKNDKTATISTINTQPPYAEYTKLIFDSAYGSTNLYEQCKLEIKKVIFNKPATIVFWSDGTKTIVKCGENDIYDPEKGLAMAVAKKFLGTNKSHSNYMNEFKKWLPKEEDKLDPFEDAIYGLKNLFTSNLKEKDHD